MLPSLSLPPSLSLSLPPSPSPSPFLPLPSSLSLSLPSSLSLPPSLSPSLPLSLPPSLPPSLPLSPSLLSILLGTKERRLVAYLAYHFTRPKPLKEDDRLPGLMKKLDAICELREL